jgi:hypothetical protein
MFASFSFSAGVAGIRRFYESWLMEQLPGFTASDEEGTASGRPSEFSFGNGTPKRIAGSVGTDLAPGGREEAVKAPSAPAFVMHCFRNTNTVLQRPVCVTASMDVKRPRQDDFEMDDIIIIMSKASIF